MKALSKPGASKIAASAVGLIGFAGLLVASNVAGAWATPLRVAAIAWLLAFGLLKLAIDLMQRR